MKLIDMIDNIEDLEQALEEHLESESPMQEVVEYLESLLEKAEGNRDEKLLSVARWRKQLDAESKEVIGGEIKRLQSRKRSQDNKVKSLGQFLQYGLSKVEDNKVKSALGTLWLQNNPKPTVEIKDYNVIPDEYWKVYTVQNINQVVELPAGTYKIQFAEENPLVDGANIALMVVDTDSIGKHWIATGEVVAGTDIRQGQHVRFR